MPVETYRIGTTKSPKSRHPGRKKKSLCTLEQTHGRQLRYVPYFAVLAIDRNSYGEGGTSRGSNPLTHSKSGPTQGTARAEPSRTNESSIATTGLQQSPRNRISGRHGPHNPPERAVTPCGWMDTTPQQAGCRTVPQRTTRCRNETFVEPQSKQGTTNITTPTHDFISPER